MYYIYTTLSDSTNTSNLEPSLYFLLIYYAMKWTIHLLSEKDKSCASIELESQYKYMYIPV